jgi:WD40 repeat protein
LGSSASFFPNGARIAITSGGDNTVELLDAATGQNLVKLRVRERISGVTGVDKLRGVTMSCASFSPDGARVLTISSNGDARLWDATTGRELIHLYAHASTGSVTGSFSPDGARILTGYRDGMARLWDAKTGRELIHLYAHRGSVMSASFSPDGARILTASDDRTARLWDAKTGRALIVIRGHRGSVLSASFSPDGTASSPPPMTARRASGTRQPARRSHE